MRYGMRAMAPALGLALLLWAGPAAAGSIPCEVNTCGWSISVGGTEMMSGSYDIDADGNLSLAAPVSMTTANFEIGISSISGNTDPEIVFSASASNTSGGPLTFAFAFSLPLGGFSGLVDTYAELGQTLTAPTGGGDLLMYPTLGGGLIVDSQDIRFSPFDSKDKDVDVGDALTALDGSTELDLDTASSQITLAGGGYDVMSVVVAFGLDRDGEVGLSGRVRQTLAPEPGTALLLGLGVIAFAIRRRI